MLFVDQGLDGNRKSSFARKWFDLFELAHLVDVNVALQILLELLQVLFGLAKLFLFNELNQYILKESFKFVLFVHFFAGLAT